MREVHQMKFGEVYSGRRVWLTGDTGFKGSWLAFWLHRLGAEVLGIGLEPETDEGPFVRAELDRLVRHETVDIRDGGRMAALTLIGRMAGSARWPRCIRRPVLA